MSKISRLTFQILWIFYVLRSISNQVNTNTQQLYDDFRDKARGSNYSVDWFKPDKFSSFATFFLCVDVFQKLMNVTLTGGLYQVNTPNNDLPNFRVESLNITFINAPYELVLRNVIQCPLNLVSFENMNYMLGTEFYITESPNEYCVYSLYPEYQLSNTEPLLYITAEICGLFLKLRYDKFELEKEFEDHLINKGVDLLTWPQLNQMDNKGRLLLCLHVHEKLAYQGYFRVPYRSYNPCNELPICNVVANDFIFTTYKGLHPKGFIDTLHCPLNTIEFEMNRNRGRYMSPPRMKPYYLAQSVNPNCVYKLGISGPIYEWKMNNNLSHEVFILAEICGISGTVNQNIEQIELKVLSILDTIHRADLQTGGELVLLSDINKRQLCGDVYRTIYRDYQYLSKPFYTPSLRETILHIGNFNITINTLNCIMIYMDSDSAMPLAYSPSLGCVYKLRILQTYQKLATNVKIEYEICDVYPARHFLHIRKTITRPII